MIKTNTIRILDSFDIDYEIITYNENLVDGESIAEALKEDKYSVFKTLVTKGSDKNYYVFCIPVNTTLDLKRAAIVAKCKSIEMIHQKELLPLTGYIHGGCSPIGMKKKFVTFINDTAQIFENIYISGGKVGIQLKINPYILCDFINATFADVVTRY